MTSETGKLKIVGLGGTARPNSTSECAVRMALAKAEAMGCEVQLFDGAFVSALPFYVPGKIERNEAEVEFVRAVRKCDGMIVASPGYHGSLSGPIKNALDLLEDLSKDERVYLDGRAFGAIVTAFGWQACGTTLVTLRSIAHALRAWPTPFGATINASGPLFDADGACLDDKVQGQLEVVAEQVVTFARWRRAGIAAGE